MPNASACQLDPCPTYVISIAERMGSQTAMHKAVHKKFIATVLPDQRNCEHTRLCAVDSVIRPGNSEALVSSPEHAANDEALSSQRVKVFASHIKRLCLGAIKGDWRWYTQYRYSSAPNKRAGLLTGYTRRKADGVSR